MSCQSHRSWLNDVAPQNIRAISTTPEVSKFDTPVPFKLWHISIDAPLNILLMSVALEVSQSQMFSLKVSIWLNNQDMSWTFPTHHEFIGHPYVCPISHSSLLEQSWLTYARTAILSSAPSGKQLLPSVLLEVKCNPKNSCYYHCNNQSQYQPTDEELLVSFPPYICLV